MSYQSSFYCGRIVLSLALFFSSTLLIGCDRLGLPDPAKEAAMRDADGRATGSACRNAGRAIEDCYALNPDASRSAVFAGWKDMNDYMRENKMEELKPIVAGHTAGATDAHAGAPMDEHSSTSAEDASKAEENKKSEKPEKTADTAEAASSKPAAKSH